MLAETHRSRTYHRPLSLPLVLKTRRNTGYEALPCKNLRESLFLVKHTARRPAGMGRESLSRSLCAGLNENRPRLSGNSCIMGEEALC